MIMMNKTKAVLNIQESATRIMSTNVDMENRLARLFRTKRIAMLVTLDELACASGVPVAELRQMETGEYFPGNGCPERVAEALGIKAIPASTSLPFIIPVIEHECEESHLQRLPTEVR